MVKERRKRGRPDEVSLVASDTELPIGEFRKAVHLFLTLIEHVGREATGDGRGPGWLISARAGSTRLAARPTPQIGASAHSGRILSTIRDGVRMLRDATTRPHGFDDVALRSARDLVSLSTVRSVRPRMRIEVRQGGEVEKIPLAPAIAHSVDEMIAVRHRDWGSIEGQLLLLAVTNDDQHAIAVHDVLTGRRIRCRITDDALFRKAYSNFERRVVATGLISYRADGEPESVDCEDLMILGQPLELPSPEDVYGILALDR